MDALMDAKRNEWRWHNLAWFIVMDMLEAHLPWVAVITCLSAAPISGQSGRRLNSIYGR